ncbi:hypothetical protein L5515_008046 [Caenorhabditis briggsae]|uniref:Uncharacterized protein n=1 Tax=Caenorhabditis briggsae TaxID=6238 RepID=A0AAE9JN24_CAEBR|nr:hypothetical protein L3Y34_008196 [Caenorhabditis briggsae]UMM35407.1 hypothetical protein L5515_008046 [Caenorhabditis briggsae]
MSPAFVILLLILISDVCSDAVRFQTNLTSEEMKKYLVDETGIKLVTIGGSSQFDNYLLLFSSIGLFLIYLRL